MSSPGLARPNQIWVYNFVANPADMPADSSIGSEVGAPSTPLTADQIQQGRQLGALIAQNLVADINAMGLFRRTGRSGSIAASRRRRNPRLPCLAAGGSAVQRFVIGFGAGTSEMDTVVEGYVVTPQGWRKLGSGTLSSSGGKSPGMVVPAAAAIATANPIGRIVVGGVKIYSETSGRSGRPEPSRARRCCSRLN